MAMLLAERATDLRARGYPTMTSPTLSGMSVLVVEGQDSGTSGLRSSLIDLGANVHVVSSIDRGLMIASRKKLHGAILDCVSHGASFTLCAQLAANDVPFMFYGGVAGRDADEAASCMVDLIGIQKTRASPRRKSFVGSGEDRHLTL